MANVAGLASTVELRELRTDDDDYGYHPDSMEAVSVTINQKSAVKNQNRDQALNGLPSNHHHHHHHHQ